MKDRVIVFDIDGTLADCEHRRHWITSKPKNWSAFYADLVNDPCIESVASLARHFWRQEATVILCSGRPEYDDGAGNIREATQSWLSKKSIGYDALIMRPARDYRGDDILKVEFLNRIRQGYGEPSYWFDDRDRVVKAIRNEGVQVFQVTEGNF